LPTTSPLRSLKDIRRVIKLLKKCDFVVTGSVSKRSPWFNMLKVEKNLNAKIFFQQKKKYTNRQLAPRTYDLTTVAYASRPSYIMRMKNIFDGKVKLSEIPTSRALDIDEVFDLKIAKLLMK
jgi:N-acylneuraminate cytidylyltransferase